MALVPLEEAEETSIFSCPPHEDIVRTRRWTFTRHRLGLIFRFPGVQNSKK
jgi:hypothetical protein